MKKLPKQLFKKAVDVKPNELRALGFGFVFNFLVLASYYVVRPIRDDIGAAGGLDNLSWMYTGTMVAMLLANVLFSGLVAKFSRRWFIPIANVIGFLTMGWMPLLSLLVVFQTLRRASNFAVSRPAREVLFTVLVLSQYLAGPETVGISARARGATCFDLIDANIAAALVPQRNSTTEI